MVLKIVLEVCQAGIGACPWQHLSAGELSTTVDFFDAVRQAFPNIMGSAMNPEVTYVLYTSCGKKIGSRTPIQDIKAANFIYIFNEEFLTNFTSRQLFADF